MRKADNRTGGKEFERKRNPRIESSWVEKYHAHEVSALLLGGFAVMVLLALISHAPDHLPSWVPTSQSGGDSRFAGNFVGPIGAIGAGFLYYLFGAAAYLIPVILIWWAIQIVTTERAFGIRNFIALAVSMISAACIVDCQAVFFQDWVAKYNLPGSTGGFAGRVIGHDFFVRFFGPGGSFVIMIIISMLSLIVITGIHPFRFARHIGQQVFQWLKKIDWEREWTLWTGINLKESETIRRTPRSLPAPRIITIEDFDSDDFDANDFDSEDFDPDKVTIEPNSLVIEDREVEETLPARPAPVRPRNIIDASQRHHRPVTTPPSAPPEIQNPFAATRQYEGYQLPSFEILSYAKDLEPAEANHEALIQIQNVIVDTLSSFNVDVEPGDITKGPTITRFEVYPSAGLRVNRITTLKDDIARATRAERINILAPIPGKDTVGIEIANSSKVTVAIRELFESDTFRDTTAKLPLVLGKDVYGKTIVGDLAKMPHLLVAGATGSGKSVCINSIIASLLYRFSPDELKFIMIDPKVVEMQLYNALPHMVVPVVTDPKKVILALRWILKEMEARYAMFAKKGVRNFESFNRLRAKEVRGQEIAEDKVLQPNLVNTETGEDFLMSDDFGESRDPLPEGTADSEDMPESLPYIVVIVDELADLMQTAPADVETGIARIAQKARAAGIHLVIATQTPRADVITGTIKANIPSRIAFQVSSKTDSRIILDENGAENLVGKGDMLYLPPGSAQHIRAQGALITDEEAHALVNACASQGRPNFEAGDDAHFGFPDEEEECEVSDADEEIISRCMEVIFAEKKASTSLLQRKLRLGYTRAARMIDILESRGVIGPGDGAKPREVLVDLASE